MAAPNGSSTGHICQEQSGLDAAAARGRAPGQSPAVGNGRSGHG